MRSIYYLIISISLINILTGCSPTKHLKDNEFLLYKQSISGNKSIHTDELTPYYRVHTNRRIFGIMPYVSIYNLGKKLYDTARVKDKIKSLTQEILVLDSNTSDSTKRAKERVKLEKKLESQTRKLNEGNWLMRVPGEAPVIYDSSIVNETTNQFGYFIFSKGFFQSRVSSSIDTIGRKVKVKYEINEGPEYKIFDIKYNISNSTINNINNANLGDAVIKEGERYDQSKIVEERDRLYKLLKNNGYFDFNRQFVIFNIDTVEKKEKVAIDVIIKEPQEGSHIQYSIDSIFFEMDVVNSANRKKDTSIDVRNPRIIYEYYKNNFSKNILYYKLRFKPGDQYNQKLVQETQNQLASLDMYKFVNINFVKDKDTSIHALNAYIRTSPFNKFQISDEWGVNVGQGFIPGPYASLSFKDRNVLKGFEIFEATVKYSLEAVYPQREVNNQDKPILMKEYGGNVSLSFPQILFPGFHKKMHNYSPRTRIQAGYGFVNRPEYTRKTLRGALSYNWIRSAYKQFNVNLLDINIVNTPRIDSGFNARLLKLDALGNKLILSFNNSIVTSFNTYYVFTNNEFGKRKKSKYFKPYFEVGGNIVNLLSREITHEPANKFLGLQYFEFFKVSADTRFYFPVARRSTYAMRFYAGYARPYGSSAKDGIFVLPYDKYFFSGGPSSIRAWKPRRLGPGSYKDPVNNYLYEQPGDIIFETNHEYRFNIFSFIDWAFFIDAGNVWSIREEPGTPGSQFQFQSFIPQIAVGTGYGLRLDFTFLILRFDVGLKVWDPGNKGAERFVGKYLVKYPFIGRSGQALFNIGIGYPF